MIRPGREAEALSATAFRLAVTISNIFAERLYLLSRMVHTRPKLVRYQNDNRVV